MSESESEIVITAYPVFLSRTNFVGVPFGRPAIEKTTVDTLLDAENEALAMHNRLKAKGVNHQILTKCFGLKPRGFDARKPSYCFFD